MSPTGMEAVLPTALRTVSPGGTPLELRAVESEDAVTLEQRRLSHEPSSWQPLRIGDLVDLLRPGSEIYAWLEDHGVLWGAWLGRGPTEIASFTKAPERRLPKRAKSK